MRLLMLGVVLGIVFIEYPAFSKREGIVEAVIDRGPISEFVIRCPKGTAIFSYSKVDRQFCTARLECFASMKTAAAAACR